MVLGSLVLGCLLHCVDPASTKYLAVILDTLGEPMVTRLSKKFDLGKRGIEVLATSSSSGITNYYLTGGLWASGCLYLLMG